MQFLRGVHDSTIIDDAYNAAPLSMKLAIETAKGIKAKRKIAIIGDMCELGIFSPIAHKEIGALTAKVFDVIVAVGPEAKYYVEAAIKAKVAKKNIIYSENVDDVLAQLPALVRTGDLVLVKASHTMHLDKAVAALRIAGPEDLVRR